MISVIVPIYNTEKYLPKCLDSLFSQTYPDVEFILVDDGSTDNSGVIADRYTDPRFRVFHTENRGLSAARNFGIEQARGEWLMFVDGDDHVEPGFCELPFQAAIHDDADIVMFKVYHERNGRFKRDKLPVCTELIDWEKAVRYGGAAVWNKLYRRELFDGIRYPEGRVFEDISVTHKILLRAKRIIAIPDCLYHYVYRKGSLSNCFSVKNKRDAFAASLERAETLESLNCAKDLFEPLLIKCAITFLFMTGPSEDILHRKAENIADSVKGVPSFLPWTKKVLLMVWKTNKTVFYLLCRFLRRSFIFKQT